MNFNFRDSGGFPNQPLVAVSATKIQNDNTLNKKNGCCFVSSESSLRKENFM